MEKYLREPTQEPATSPQPLLAAEGKKRLTSKRKKILEATIRRHDKALKMLANM